MLGFKAFRNAAITIAGIELLQRIRKGQFKLGRLGIQGQAAPEVWNAVALEVSPRRKKDARLLVTAICTRARRSTNAARPRGPRQRRSQNQRRLHALARAYPPQ